MTNQQLGYGKYGNNTYNTLNVMSKKGVPMADPFKSSKGQATNKGFGTQPIKPTMGDKATFLPGSKVNVMNQNEGGPGKQIKDNIVNNMQRETKRVTGVSVPGNAYDMHKRNSGIQDMLNKKFGDNSGKGIFSKFTSIFQDTDPITKTINKSDEDTGEVFYKERRGCGRNDNCGLYGDDSTPNRFDEDKNINRKLYKGKDEILMNVGNTVWSSKSSLRKGHGGSMQQSNGCGLTIADSSLGKGIKEMYLFSCNSKNKK
jgi:hypothetical protein